MMTMAVTDALFSIEAYFCDVCARTPIDFRSAATRRVARAVMSSDLREEVSFVYRTRSAILTFVSDQRMTIRVRFALHVMHAKESIFAV